jgi:putative colanic acid biosynthesis glycosyltransferase
MPGLTIITIHLNDFEGLARTHESLKLLLASEYLEWIVIDGDSNLENVGDDFFTPFQNAAKQFISEPDEGIFDAMNKGSRLANGDYVLFLNAGDELHPDFRPEHLENVLKMSQPDMVWGRCEIHYENGSAIQLKTRSSSWTWYGMPVAHPAIFFRRNKLGVTPYDTRYHIGADYALVCRLVTAQARIAYLDGLISIFHRGGLSDVSGDVAFDEENAIRLRYFSLPPWVGAMVKQTRKLSARLASHAGLRNLWRKRI